MKQSIKALFGAAALSIAAASAALAADMPVKAPLYTKAPAVSADPWTGWYAGASLGGRFDKDPWTTTALAAGTILVDPRDNPHNFKSDSARLGFYGGYNWRIQQTWVVGFEGDFAWANNKNTNNGGVPGVAAAPFSAPTQVKDTWDGGLRLRAGYLITPSTLLFGTGGVAWMRSQASVTCDTNFLTSWCSGTNQATGRTDSVSKTVAGWTAGGGLETIVAPNWFLRAEYRYANYHSYHATLLPNGSVFGLNLDQIDANIKPRTQTALLGIAYHFGR